METRERAYRIGEVAERVGVTTRTIRYYEELGLLGASARSKGTHRTYIESDVQHLEELIRLRDLLGLSLDELTELAEAEEARAALCDRWTDDASDAERLRIVEEAIPIVEHQLELVRGRRKTLDRFAADLDAKLKLLYEKRGELAPGEQLAAASPR